MDATNRRAVLKGALGAAAIMPVAMPGTAWAASRDIEAIRRAVKDGHEASLKRLRDWIALPTIAAEGRNVPEGADYMAGLAREAGFQHVEIVPTDGSPGVFATMDNGARKTLALYFMYDVKQYDPAEWSSPPLEGRIVERAGLGKVLVARGAVNQKGPEAILLQALHAFKASGRKLPVNLVLVCEGEEEIGSPHFAQIVRRPDITAALKKSIGAVIPSAWQAPTDGAVVVNLGAKGIIECELISSGEKWGRGPAKDLHSSNKAIVDSPAWHLVEALQTLVTPDGNLPAIDGWFEKVRPLSARERALIADSAAKSTAEGAMKAMGVKHFVDDLPWPQVLERGASTPTVNIEGMIAGYTGPGGKTILPSRAVAKLDMRLVPNQTFEDCVAKLKAHLAKRGYADIEVKVTGGYDPTETDENASLIKAQLAAYARAGITTSVYPRLSGSWPGYVFTSAPVSLPAGQFGFGHGSGAHAPDEYLLIDSTNPKVLGMDDSAMGFVDFFYQVAATG
ncbi:MAG: M20/M25/M40 family metallo-hydrolase [Sphingomonas sp.]